MLYNELNVFLLNSKVHITFVDMAQHLFGKLELRRTIN
ncbi:hypothetical protein EVA_04669 [gut metagenome]|uniref:Uncharacterized protein n=1 Tax=gut metagenome TaxID=749906 RepID=J9GJ33_9ZZZZ